MSYETFDPTAHGWRIQRGYTIDPQDQYLEEESEIGSKKSTAVSERTPRILRNFRMIAATRDAWEYLESFFRRQKGPVGRWYFAWPEYVSSPDAAPVLEAVAGGALAERSVTLRYAWKNATGTTKASPTATLVVPVNELVKVTLDPYPSSVTQAVIYGAEDAPGVEQEQATITLEQSWTQPAAALLVSTADPPAANTALDTPLCKLMGGRPVVRQVGTQYETTLTIEECYA